MFYGTQLNKERNQRTNKQMGMQLNDVRIVGNLTREAEVHYTPQGTPVANASLGVNESYTIDNQKKNVTTFVDVQLWGAAAENFAKFVEKGQQIFVEGALRQDTWQDKETKQNRSKLFVKANSWQFVQYKATEAARQAANNRSMEVTR
jgi:single-strand DNA-binding protein